jgi:hypothetical protein
VLKPHLMRPGLIQAQLDEPNNLREEEHENGSRVEKVFPTELHRARAVMPPIIPLVGEVAPGTATEHPSLNRESEQENRQDLGMATVSCDPGCHPKRP